MAQEPAISSPLASFLTSFPPRRNCISVVIWRRKRSQGTIFEFDSVGCQQLLINSWARARSGCGALDRVLSKGSWCFHNQKSFPDPVPNSKIVCVTLFDPKRLSLKMKSTHLKLLSKICFVLGFASIVGSIAIWYLTGGQAIDTQAHGERFGIFVGLWAPTFFILSNRFERFSEKAA